MINSKYLLVSFYKYFKFCIIFKYNISRFLTYTAHSSLHSSRFLPIQAVYIYIYIYIYCQLYYTTNNITLYNSMTYTFINTIRTHKTTLIQTHFTYL